MTPNTVNQKLATKQAKAWGFKSVVDAANNGYQTLRTSCEMIEIAEVLKVSISEANAIAQVWKSNGLVTISKCANLDTVYFNKYK
jgi:hypothetical protein